MKFVDMLSTSDLKKGICRWLLTQESRISFTIDQHSCALVRTNRGVSCFIDINVARAQISADLLLQLTRAGLALFPGTPVLSTDGRYLLGVWQATSGVHDEDGEKLLATIESLINQSTVWNELASNTSSSQRDNAQIERLRLTARLSQHPIFL